MIKAFLPLWVMLFSWFVFACFQNAEADYADLPQVKQSNNYPASTEKWNFTIDRDRSDITFLIKGNIHDTNGFVSMVNGEITALLSADGILTKSEVKIIIKSNDLCTKNKTQDRRMKNKFLEVDRFPEIVFIAAEIKERKGQYVPFKNSTREQPLSIILKGYLTLHGKTKEILLNIDTHIVKDRLITDGSTKLNLKDFDIENPSLMFLRVDDEVNIRFHIESIRE
jgi:polyisoprenoid-binding protein YceI